MTESWEKAEGQKRQQNGGSGRAGDHGEGLGVWDAVAKAVGGEAGSGNSTQHASAPPDLEPLSDGDLAA